MNISPNMVYTCLKIYNEQAKVGDYVFTTVIYSQYNAYTTLCKIVAIKDSVYTLINLYTNKEIKRHILDIAYLPDFDKIADKFPEKLI